LAEIISLVAERAVSTLADEVETLVELASIVPKMASRLDEDTESESELARFVAILALTELRDASMLEDDPERPRELAFAAVSAESRLLDDCARLPEEP
jgi:hypothetical protein